MTGRQITKLVDGLLMKYQNCRDSDSDLIIGVLQALGAGLTPEQREIIRGVNFESVRRHRQAQQAKGLYPASPEVEAQRKKKGEMIRDAVGAKQMTLAEELLAKPTPDWMEGLAGVV